jgi:hypothetical protein
MHLDRSVRTCRYVHRKTPLTFLARVRLPFRCMLSISPCGQGRRPNEGMHAVYTSLIQRSRAPSTCNIAVCAVVSVHAKRCVHGSVHTWVPDLLSPPPEKECNAYGQRRGQIIHSNYLIVFGSRHAATNNLMLEASYWMAVCMLARH